MSIGVSLTMNKKHLIKLLAFCLITVLTFISLLVFGFGIEEPEIKEQAFQFSITYEFDGETKTIDDEVTFKFDRAGANLFEADDSYWTQEFKIAKEHTYLIKNEEHEILLYTGLNPHFYMGDPYFIYWAQEAEGDFEKINQPYAYYVVGEKETYDQDEIAKLTGFKIVSFNYPSAIQNGFSFSGIDLNAEAGQYMLILSIAAVIISLFLFKKKEDLEYGNIDRISIVLNIINTILVLPFISLAGLMWDIAGAEGFEAILAHIMPSLAVLGIGASVYLRKQGFRMIGLLIQFLGPLMLFSLIVIDFFNMLF